jgi:hypothetical protein
MTFNKKKIAMFAAAVLLGVLAVLTVQAAVINFSGRNPRLVDEVISCQLPYSDLTAGAAWARPDCMPDLLTLGFNPLGSPLNVSAPFESGFFVDPNVAFIGDTTPLQLQSFLDRSRFNDSPVVPDSRVYTTISPVPEPSTWSMGLVGLVVVGVGVMARRRHPPRI